MGKIYSKLTRPIRTFNIENRAERVISREKPIPAPQYAATEKQKKLVNEVNPHFLEDHYKKNVQLDQRLKDVFVTSIDPQIKEMKKESGLLPQKRHRWENEIYYEFFEPAVIPAGKCSLKQALSFILQHKEDPTTYTSEHIASEYNLDKKVVDDILKYFKLYESVMPTVKIEQEEDGIQQYIDQGVKLKKEKDLEKKK